MNVKKNGKPAIYKIVNKINGKIYVGSCIGHYRRKAQHLWKLRQGTHDNNHLQSAWNKYNEENFEFIIIEFINNSNDLINREQYWIDKLKVCNNKVGYNKAPQAGNNFGCKMSLLSRKRMSASKKGVSPTPEVARQRGLSSRKPVNQYSKNGKFIKTFTGLVEASNILRIPQYQISKVLSKNYPWNKTAGGYRWSYVKQKQKL